MKHSEHNEQQQLWIFANANNQTSWRPPANVRCKQLVFDTSCQLETSYCLITRQYIIILCLTLNAISINKSKSTYGLFLPGGF